MVIFEVRFKVGDKVRIREWDDMAKEFKVDKDGDIKTSNKYFCRNMKKYCGVVCEVINVDRNYDYYELNNIDDDECIFDDDMLIPYKFGKMDLKTGMVVETKGNGVYLVFGNRLISFSGYEPLSYYNEDLSHSTNNDFDIIRCFDISDTVYSVGSLCTHIGSLLWERRLEEKVISSDEAFKVLKEHYGCDVKIKE